MKNKIIILLFFTSFIFAKDVLLLHSYHKGYEWTDSISLAIEKSFKNTNVEITTEYMDTKRIYNKDYLESLLTFYQKRYKNRKFDVIIASDNNALEFLNTYHDKIFTNTPIVFCGFNNFDKKVFDTYSIKERTTGVIEEVDIEKNINLILKLHPKLKKLLVINDTTTTGMEMKKEFFKIYDRHKNDIDIEYIDKFKIEDLQKKVKELDENSAILFMLLHKDETGKIFTFKDGLKKIDSISSVPIYGLWDFYVHYGLVGGFVTHGYQQGEYASKIVKEILNGVRVSMLPIVMKSPNSYIFDFHKLKKFDIDTNDLPINYLLENEPETFYESYQTEITIITIAFILFTIIIFFLIASLEEKRKAKNELKIQLNFIEALLNTLQNPIFYKDKDGKYIGCNEAFCEFIGYPKEEIIGKTMYDFFGHHKEFIKAHEDIESKLFNNEEVGKYILDYKMKEGVKTLIINKSLFHGSNKSIEGIVTILHDITDLVRMQSEKTQHESFFLQQSKLAEIGEMINAIAHQWNEPLVEMSAIVQDIELEYKTTAITDKSMDSFVRDSMIQIQYMSKTLKDFRDFLKPSVQKSNFDIKDAFHEVLNIIERQIKYSYIEFNIKYGPSHLMVYGYKNEFMQVLITIINNSKDAILKLRSTNNNYPGKIDVKISSYEDIVEILIIDNGCGIRQKDLNNLFDPYYSTKPKGNGLGLYMSRILIEDKMNGKIHFKDSKNCTTLAIELPKKAMI